MSLSDVQCRNAKPTEKPYKLTDGGGLYLLIQPHGAKLWRQNYRFQGKQKTLAIGAYPQTTLSQARARLADAKRLLAEGMDPGAQRKAGKLAALELARNTFEAVALEWHGKQAEVWTASHAALVLRALRPIETRGVLETAHRARTIASQMMRFGIATGRCDRDPAGDLRGALPPLKVKHIRIKLRLEKSLHPV